MKTLVTCMTYNQLLMVHAVCSVRKQLSGQSNIVRQVVSLEAPDAWSKRWKVADLTFLAFGLPFTVSLLCHGGHVGIMHAEAVTAGEMFKCLRGSV